MGYQHLSSSTQRYCMWRRRRYVSILRNGHVQADKECRTFQECPVFQPYITSATCSPDKGQLVETTSYKDMVPVSALPGCNPLWSSGSKPTCSGSVAQPDVTKLTGTDGSKLASKPQNLVLPTTPGWKAISCIGDSNNMLVNQIRYYDPNVTQTSCLDSCLRSGYSYASIGFSWGQSWVSELIVSMS